MECVLASWLTAGQPGAETSPKPGAFLVYKGAHFHLDAPENMPLSCFPRGLFGSLLRIFGVRTLPAARVGSTDFPGKKQERAKWGRGALTSQSLSGSLQGLEGTRAASSLALSAPPLPNAQTQALGGAGDLLETQTGVSGERAAVRQQRLWHRTGVGPRLPRLLLPVAPQEAGRAGYLGKSQEASESHLLGRVGSVVQPAPE